MSCPTRAIAHPSPLPRRPRAARRGRKDAASVVADLEGEAAFRRWLQELLTLTGWLWSYIPDSRRVVGHRGIPDIQAVRGERVLYIELKTTRGRLSQRQLDWAHALLACGRVEYFLWKPTDRAWIEQALR